MNNAATNQKPNSTYSASALLVPFGLAALAVLAVSLSSTTPNTAPQVESSQPQWLTDAPTLARQADSLELDAESPRSCCDQS
jgi:hypothetical protein